MNDQPNYMLSPGTYIGVVSRVPDDGTVTFKRENRYAILEHAHRHYSKAEWIALKLDRVEFEFTVKARGEWLTIRTIRNLQRHAIVDCGETLSHYWHCLNKRRDLENNYTASRRVLLKMLRQSTAGVAPGLACHVETVESRSVDYDLLRDKYPEAYKACVNTKKSKRLTVQEVKEPKSPPKRHVPDTFRY